MTDQTRYDFKEIEPRIYKMWQDKGCFNTAVSESGEVRDAVRAKADPYVIVIPPPNVTGRLHMGHALNNSIQDIYTRYKRMDGYDALWVPGTDHAGIATQTVVKKMLDAEGIDYRELGRDDFTKKVWEWKEKYGDIILNQLKTVGFSCNWERTRFTMDEGLSKAVAHTFKKLYDEGLIYRGKRIVNWCPVDKTALSDDEVETKEGGEKGFLWQIKYLLADGSGHVIVATTRPETLFGDVAVAVNPKDDRFKHLIGKEVIVPLQGRKVPIIGDEYVDMEFGTGCLKITPAHDPNDFEIGTRHHLVPINVMNEDATMNEVVPEKYQGLDRYKCRELAIEDLKEAELLVSEEERMTPLGRSYRSKAVIEYRLSDQWFVKMKPLAEKVLAMHDQLNIQPARWNKVYLSWLENIRDWCISRQIWWGHRIPAWYHVETEEILVSETTPKQVLDNPQDWRQEEDVLDTWFSSALWPMSTLGWPETTPDFDRYFPTSTLVTGKDIIFFWVARMNMMAVHFTGKLPYKNVFINPIVLDEKGETMSKSKGNGIDPLTVVNGATLEELENPVREARPSNMKEILKRLEKNFPEGYEAVGADALRYTLIYLCSSGQQLKISMSSFHDLGRRFLTKLWNASRFIFMYMEQEAQKGGDVPDDFDAFTRDEDRWVRAKLQVTVNKVRDLFDAHDFTNLGQTYYHYVWNDFCDWYIELAKVRLTSDNAQERKTALHHLAVVFSKTLALLHPLIPHVTEELWSRLLPLADEHKLWGGERPKSSLLITEQFPLARNLLEKEAVITKQFTLLQDMIGAVRTLRKTYQIKDKEKLSVSAVALDDVAQALFAQSIGTIKRLAGLEEFTLLSDASEKPAKTVTLVDQSYEVYLDVSSYIDVDKEKARLEKEITKLEKQTGGLKQRLQNQGFLQNADPQVVEEQKLVLAQNIDQLQKLNNLYKDLKTW
ncbi:MAG: valine--tRNA ligase [Deltaproteobacteria bacterium]|nr:valine--tRNA ligase [Deltaproteobacteria bacterium]